MKRELINHCVVIDSKSHQIRVSAANDDSVIDQKIINFHGILSLLEQHPCCIIYFIYEDGDKAHQADGLIKKITLNGLIDALESKAWSYVVRDTRYFDDVFDTKTHMLLSSDDNIQPSIYTLIPVIKHYLPGVVGCSQAVKNMAFITKKIAKVNKSVLIQGPSGSGKELIANAIHELSPFCKGTLVDVNCSSIPENLIESILFGHEKGAFTGADGAKDGLFFEANNGSLFLDEIADLPFVLQAKLLRVLETRRFRKLGSLKDIEFNGRIIAATHKDLQIQVSEGKFREDLYYRLSVFTIHVPPLNQRSEDIPQLIEAFQSHISRTINFGDRAIELLKKHRWRGNVRELKNLMDRLSVLCDEDIIDTKTLSEFMKIEFTEDVTDENFEIKFLAEKILSSKVKNKFLIIEETLINRAMELSDGNKSAAARMLGVHRKVIERKCALTESAVDNY